MFSPCTVAKSDVFVHSVVTRHVEQRSFRYVLSFCLAADFSKVRYSFKCSVFPYQASCSLKSEAPPAIFYLPRGEKARRSGAYELHAGHAPRISFASRSTVLRFRGGEKVPALPHFMRSILGRDTTLRFAIVRGMRGGFEGHEKDDHLERSFQLQIARMQVHELSTCVQA